jgi:RHS repeat-associated protein
MFFSTLQNTCISSTCTGFVLHSFNGKEKDDEWNGTTGGALDFGARIYDSRICRWMSVDPLAKKYASNSPYQFCFDNPNLYKDPTGEAGVVTIYTVTDQKIADKLGVKVGETILLIETHFIVYGTALDKVDGNKVAENVETRWNEAKGVETITDASGNKKTYPVRFLVTAEEVPLTDTDKDNDPAVQEAKYMSRVSGISGGLSDPKNNYVRVETKESSGIEKSKVHGGSSGFWLIEDALESKTTSPHEFGHLLGLENSTSFISNVVPSIMVAAGALDENKNYVKTEDRKVTQTNITNLGIAKALQGGLKSAQIGFRDSYMFDSGGVPSGTSGGYNESQEAAQEKKEK